MPETTERKQFSIDGKSTATKVHRARPKNLRCAVIFPTDFLLQTTTTNDNNNNADDENNKKIVVNNNSSRYDDPVCNKPLVQLVTKDRTSIGVGSCCCYLRLHSAHLCVCTKLRHPDQALHSLVPEQNAHLPRPLRPRLA